MEAQKDPVTRLKLAQALWVICQPLLCVSERGGWEEGGADGIPTGLWLFQSASQTKSVCRVLRWQISVYRNLLDDLKNVTIIIIIQLSKSVHSEWVAGVKTLKMGLLSSQRCWNLCGARPLLATWGGGARARGGEAALLHLASVTNLLQLGTLTVCSEWPFNSLDS